MSGKTSKVQWITVLSSAVGHTPQGFSIDYSWDGQYFTGKGGAISHGFELQGCDDFNVAAVRNGQLVSLWWMSRQITESAETLAAIGREIGL